MFHYEDVNSHNSTVHLPHSLDINSIGKRKARAHQGLFLKPKYGTERPPEKKIPLNCRQKAIQADSAKTLGDSNPFQGPISPFILNERDNSQEPLKSQKILFPSSILSYISNQFKIGK